jgi:putative sporulation protein YtxC
MEPITIEINSFRKKTHEIIDLYPLDSIINMEINKLQDRSIYMIKLHNEIDAERIDIYNWTTRLIQNIILKVHGAKLINSRLIKLLKAVGKEEKNEILNGVILLLNDDGICSKEKIAIKDEIGGCLLESNLFNIDGYLRFKPQKINRLIDKSIEIVVDDMEMENEYNEFLDMLQFYVDGQIPMIDMVNVVIEKDDFKLFDSYNNKIESQSINEVIDDIYFDDINKSDILVSSLIVLAPKKIMMHLENDKEEDLLIILKKIFRDRLSFCYGCNICRFNIKKNNDGE